MAVVRTLFVAALLVVVVAHANYVLPGELSPSIEDPRLGDEESALHDVPTLDAMSSVDPSFRDAPDVSASLHDITDHALDKEPSTFHRKVVSLPPSRPRLGLGPMFMLPDESSGVADGSSSSTTCTVEHGVRHCTSERHTRHCERRSLSATPACREWTEHHHTYTAADGSRMSSAKAARRAAAAAAARVSSTPTTSTHVECAKHAGGRCVEHTHTVHRETHCSGTACTHDIHHEHCTHPRGAPASAAAVCTHSVEHVHFEKKKKSKY